MVAAWISVRFHHLGFIPPALPGSIRHPGVRQINFFSADWHGYCFCCRLVNAASASTVRLFPFRWVQLLYLITFR